MQSTVRLATEDQSVDGYLRLPQRVDVHFVHGNPADGRAGRLHRRPVREAAQDVARVLHQGVLLADQGDVGAGEPIIPERLKYRNEFAVGAQRPLLIYAWSS